VLSPAASGGAAATMRLPYHELARRSDVAGE
jgi:hypothetical protein